MCKGLLFLFLICTLNLSLSAEEEASPIFAGTLLAYYSENADPGFLSVQPYLLYSSYYGSYDKNWAFKKSKTITEIEIFTSLETGITKTVDVTLVLDSFYSQVGKEHSIRYADTELLFGFQLLRDKKGTTIPDLRLIVGESFPTGKYDKLNPKKLFSDLSGSGVYEFWAILILQKIFYSIPNHPFSVNLNLQYIHPVTKAGVEGFNAYGGGFGTKGAAKVGDELIVNLAFDFILDPHWQLGLDLHYEHQNRSTFLGKRGVDQKGQPAFVGVPSSEQFSIAPALEYVYNEFFGLAGGVWFTVAGRNDVAFITPLFTVYYYF
ncbi:MAG: hypothetical protein HYZ47_01400 [Simkania negevensis]|nr:hypothetical protein [Simkania negevensis]